MNTELLTPMEEAVMVNPSADKTTRCATDQIIRSRGYVIKSRPEDGEAVWERSGILFTQSDVVRREKL